MTSLCRTQVRTIFRPRVSDRDGLKQLPPVAEAAVLNNFRYAKQAEYRHGDRNRCLKGTRRAILDEIALWTRDFVEPPVYWLNGLAGTGKSTIAQTIAEKMFADGQLGASFFCSRDFEDRSDLKFIFPTIAVQLARSYAGFRSIFVPLVQSDPEIADESLYSQMNKLIVQPLAESAISTVIVIDALDECQDEESASAILSVLERVITDIPKVKFFVTGRPEPRIQEGFRLPLLAKATDVFVLHEVEPDQINSDIRLFFTHNLSELGRRRRLDDWPTEEQLDLLCERAAGLFVHAMATVRFVDQPNKNPKRQLERLLQSPGSSILEGKTKLKGNATLDSPYSSILQEAFDDDDPEYDLKARSVLGAVVLAANPLSPTTIASLLGFDTDDVFPPLLSVHSLLVFQEDADFPVRPFHKSFPDFITDPVRCINPRFRVRPPDQHAELLASCLALMNHKLEQNMCKFPDGVTNSEVDNLKERIDQNIDQALQYACRSWHKHLVDKISAEIAPVLHCFLEEKFLFWLEALSVLGVVREAVDALEVAEKWLHVRRTLLAATIQLNWIQESPTLNLVRDYLRFIIAFFEVISTSAPHIYCSALPLSPRTSIVRELYKNYARSSVRVVQGLPTSWEPIVATMYHDEFRGGAVWSPCDRFIAVDKSGAIDILDAVTLKRLNTFKSPTSHSTPMLSFPPGSRYLTHFGDGGLTRWDLHTGAPVGTIPGPGVTSNTNLLSSTYSADGKMVAVAHSTRPKEDASIDTYDFLSMTHKSSYRVQGARIITPIWTHRGFIRFCTVKPGSITIWEVALTLTPAPVEVESLPAPDGVAGGGGFLFLPTLSRLAFVLQGAILVWNAKTSRFLLGSQQDQAPQVTETSDLPRFSHESSFSSDGRFFACMTVDREVYVWKESPTGYLLHQALAFSKALVRARPLLSPNGESIIASVRQSIHLWPTKDHIPLDPTIQSPYGGRFSFILEFSPNEMLAAFAQEEGWTVTILDLQSGDPRLVVDAGMGFNVWE